MAALPAREPSGDGALAPAAVVDAAMALVEREGAEALTMRRLSAALGVAPTAIYWHVGNRRQLVAAMVERMVAEFGRIRPRGSTPSARLASVLRQVRAELLGRPHLVGLVNEEGRVAAMFLPAQRVLADELVAAGLAPPAVASALRTLVYHVVGFVLVELNVARQPEQPSAEELWGGVDASELPGPVLRQLQAPQDSDRVFAFATRALVAGLID